MSKGLIDVSSFDIDELKQIKTDIEVAIVSKSNRFRFGDSITDFDGNEITFVKPHIDLIATSAKSKIFFLDADYNVFADYADSLAKRTVIAIDRFLGVRASS